jgi:hypothetical protein
LFAPSSSFIFFSIITDFRQISPSQSQRNHILRMREIRGGLSKFFSCGAWKETIPSLRGEFANRKERREQPRLFSYLIRMFKLAATAL